MSYLESLTFTEPVYFDREGRPITLLTWARLFENDSYKVVKQEQVGDAWFSTVWLGLDHGFGWSESPLIFELMAFNLRGEDFMQVRLPTAEIALWAHERAVNVYRRIHLTLGSGGSEAL